MKKNIKYWNPIYNFPNYRGKRIEIKENKLRAIMQTHLMS